MFADNMDRNVKIVAPQTTGRPTTEPMIKIANAPCSWGALEFNLKEKQPVNFQQVLDEIKETGYAGTELGDWGFMPTDPARLRDEIKKRELELIGAFVPVNLSNPKSHAIGGGNAMKTGKLMCDAGFPNAYLILADDNCHDPIRTKHAGRISPAMGLNDNQWKNVSSGTNLISRRIYEELGIKTVFHHHCAGFVETPEEIDKLMEGTDPALVGLCIDTGHLYFGGGNPLTVLKKYGERIWHVHFKDCDARIAAASRTKNWDYFESISQGVFCKLGKGAIDFKAIIQELKSSSYKGWITVEQDILPGMSLPKSCARDNREFLKKLGL